MLGVGYFCQAAVLRRYPFSAPLARGESFGPIAPLAAAVGAVTMALATGHYYAFQYDYGPAAFAGGLAVVVLITRWFTRQSITRRGVSGFSFG